QLYNLTIKASDTNLSLPHFIPDITANYGWLYHILPEAKEKKSNHIKLSRLKKDLETSLCATVKLKDTCFCLAYSVAIPKALQKQSAYLLAYFPKNSSIFVDLLTGRRTNNKSFKLNSPPKLTLSRNHDIYTFSLQADSSFSHALLIQNCLSDFSHTPMYLVAGSTSF
ncbi:MAG: hypothetical protein D6780_06440, partial [Candidatus Dadabacteria bacterium]